MSSVLVLDMIQILLEASSIQCDGRHVYSWYWGHFGGSVSLSGGAGTTFSSGQVVIRSVDSGDTGVSGEFLFATGTTSSGTSGELTLSSGAATNGKGGDKDCNNRNWYNLYRR